MGVVSTRSLQPPYESRADVGPMATSLYACSWTLAAACLIIALPTGLASHMEAGACPGHGMGLDAGCGSSALLDPQMARITGNATDLPADARLVALTPDGDLFADLGTLPTHGAWAIAWNTSTVPQGAYDLAWTGSGLVTYNEPTRVHVGYLQVDLAAEPGSYLRWTSDYREGDATVETGTVRFSLHGPFTATVRPTDVVVEFRIHGDPIGYSDAWVDGDGDITIGTVEPVHWDARGQVGAHKAQAVIHFQKDTPQHTMVYLPTHDLVVTEAPAGHPSHDEPEGPFWLGAQGPDATPKTGADPVVGGIAVAVAALAWLLFEPLRVGVLGLFSRLRRDTLLDQDVRARIHAAVAADPGIHFAALRRRLGIGNGTLVHHVRVMESAGLIRSRRRGRYVRYALPGARVPPRLTPRERDVIARLDGQDAAGLARDLGISRQAAHQHLRRLQAKGIVAPDGDGWKLVA